MTEDLESKLGKSLSTGRGPRDARGPSSGEGGQQHENQRKRTFEDGATGEGPRPKRQWENTRNSHNNNNGGRRYNNNNNNNNQQFQQNNNRSGGSDGYARGGGSSGGSGRRQPQQQDQRWSRPRQVRQQKQQPKESFDNETKFRYKWTVSADQVRILSVHAFNTQIVTISSNGNIVLDTGGFKTFRVFQALNMCVLPLGLKIVADESAAANQEANAAGYKGGNWKLTHLKYKWVLDFNDGMKISAFPNRNWTKILPNLEALPESVVFSYEPSKL